VTLENSPSKVAADQPLIQAKLLSDHLRDVMQEAGVPKRYIEIPYPLANAPFSSSGFLLVPARAAGSEMVWSELACLHKPPSIASLGAQRRSWIAGCDKATRRANQKNLSSPQLKNIPLNPSGKSALPTRPSHPMRGALRNVTNARWDAVDAALAKTNAR